MNNELIERTSRAIASCKGDAPILKAVLLDCRKEIERLTIENANYVQALKCINELEAKPVDGGVRLDAITASFCRGFSEGSSQGLLDNSNNQDAVACQQCAEVAQEYVDALIAELNFLVETGAEAVRYDGDGYGYLYIDNGSGSDWRTRHKDGELMFALSDIKALIDKWRTK